MDPADRMKYDGRDDLAPTTAPTVMPSSYAPSLNPTPNPTLGPTLSAAKTVKVNIQQKINAVSYASFMLDEIKNKLVLQKTISQSLGNIPQQFIEIISVSPYNRRRLINTNNYLLQRDKMD